MCVDRAEVEQAIYRYDKGRLFLVGIGNRSRFFADH